MNKSLAVATPPAVEPVTLSEAKAHLRQDVSDEDTLIESLITAARQGFEEMTASTLIDTEYDYALARFPAGVIELPRATPLISVTSVTYTDSAGAATVLAATEYEADTLRRPGSIRPGYGKSWPSFTPFPVNPVVIRYKAGGADASEVDAAVKQWMLLTIGALYENREMVTIGGRVYMHDLSRALSHLIEPYIAERIF